MMKSVNFTIKSNQSLRIGEVLQAELFECYSVSAKDAGLKPSADSLISDFHSVQFGVKEKSSLDSVYPLMVKPIRYLFQIWRLLLTGLEP